MAQVGHTRADAGPSSPKNDASPLETFTRPPFRPTAQPPSPCILSSPSAQWSTPFAIPVHFSRSHFFAGTKDLAVHPERNSSLILRADPLPPREDPQLDAEADTLGMNRLEEIRLRLMPKQVHIDSRLNQRVAWYQDDKGRGVVFMVPEVKAVEDVPYFHPPVKKLAFIYEPVDNENGEEEGTLPVKGTLSIAYLHFEGVEANGVSQNALNDEALKPAFLNVRPAKTPRKRSPLAPTPASAPTPAEVSTDKTDPVEVEKRTIRTCRMVLERIYRHSYGYMVGYQKRVLHDVVVNRESFQDLYMILKERHRHLDSRVKKTPNSRVEDVKRHVWKPSDFSLPSDPSLPVDDVSHWGAQDVAIATFLMLLWKEMYPSRDPPELEEGDQGREWDTWGRPEGGFVDLGCGNALLVHILISEGYHGRGLELRERRTWPLYPPKTRAALREVPIAFPEWFPSTLDQWRAGEWPGKEDVPLQEGCFIIGNHADEITPWIPLLSLLPKTPVPFLSLPCCLHTLDDSFTQLTFTPPPHEHTPQGGFENGLEDGQSRYKAYLMWLGWCGLMCGWKWEKEGLRIPSTKGWGIVGRNRWAKSAEDLDGCRAWAFHQVQEVRERGVFAVREKEGKAKDH